MLPKHTENHSFAQVALIQRLSQEPSLSARDALFLAGQLVNHGFSNAGAFIERLRAALPAAATQDFLDHLARRNRVIQSLPLLKSVQDDDEAVRQLLEPTGFTFRRGSVRRDTAIVIFTTKYNNFGVSNVVADALFAQLGVSRLYLRDSSDMVYFHGAEGLPGDLPVLGDSIGELLASHGIRQSIITGFSSGGYAALYAATASRHAGFVGYAICTDIHAGSALPIPYYYGDVRGRVSPEHFVDLKPRLALEPGRRYKLFFGEKDVIYREHAAHLIGCDNVELTCRADAGHEITVQLLEDGTFLDPFEELLRTS